MYEYAVVAFYYFRNDYDSSCSGMVDCTMTTIYQGLRMDIGSAISPVTVDNEDWYARVGFDLSYFVVITTVLMNVIFGIIIDTFGALRDETQAREGYFKNTTFIACLDRSDIDKVAQDKGMSQSGWDYLEQKMHHRWNYMNFLFYLHRMSPQDLTGPESHINNLTEDGDISWMPLKICGLMQEQDKAPVQKEDPLEKSFRDLQENVREQVEILTAEIKNSQSSHSELTARAVKALEEATQEITADREERKKAAEEAEAKKKKR